MLQTHSPLISIVMPSHNSGEYLEVVIRSVLAQTYPHWELLIVDDASTDNTQAVVSRFADERIRYIPAPERLGRPSKVRNLGIRNAKGDFITFMDADDKYMENGLEVLLKPLLDNPALNASMAFPYYCDSGLNPLYPQKNIVPLPEGGYQFHPDFRLDWKNICSQRVSFFFCCTMFRKSTIETLGPLDEEFANGEDFVYHVKLLKLGLEKVHVIPTCTYWYRNHPGSITKNPERAFKNLETHVKIVNWLFSQKEIPRELHYLKAHNLSFRFATVAMMLAKMNRRDLARQIISQARNHPEIPFKIWVKYFYKQVIRVNMPFGLMNLYSRYFGNDYRWFNQSSTPKQAQN